MDDSNRIRLTVDAPELGANVEMVEGTIGEILPLMLASDTESEGARADMALQALAVSLRIDGVQLTVADLQKLGARKFRALMRLAPKALEVNGFTAGGEEDEKKD